MIPYSCLFLPKHTAQVLERELPIGNGSGMSHIMTIKTGLTLGPIDGLSVSKLLAAMGASSTWASTAREWSNSGDFTTGKRGRKLKIIPIRGHDCKCWKYEFDRRFLYVDKASLTPEFEKEGSTSKRKLETELIRLNKGQTDQKAVHKAQTAFWCNALKRKVNDTSQFCIRNAVQILPIKTISLYHLYHQTSIHQPSIHAPASDAFRSYP